MRAPAEVLTFHGVLWLEHLAWPCASVVIETEDLVDVEQADEAMFSFADPGEETPLDASHVGGRGLLFAEINADHVADSVDQDADLAAG